MNPRTLYTCSGYHHSITLGSAGLWDEIFVTQALLGGERKESPTVPGLYPYSSAGSIEKTTSS